MAWTRSVMFEILLILRPDIQALWALFSATSGLDKKLSRRWDGERELFLRRHRTCTMKHNGRLAYIVQQGVVIVRTENFNRKPKIKIKWNLDDKLKVSNVKWYTDSFVSSRQCVNLLTHTNFTVLCAIEADFWSISSMLEHVVRSWNAGLPN